MKAILRVGSLLGLASLTCLAENWTGMLVDSSCYAASSTNVSADAGHTGTDGKRKIRYCAPDTNTKSFAVVKTDGSTVELDANGKAKAAQLVQKTGRKSPYKVHLTGELNQNVVQVNQITAK